MPNHCETQLTIVAPRASVERIRLSHFDSDGALSLLTLVEIPYTTSDDARIKAQQDAWGTNRETWHIKGVWVGANEDGRNDTLKLMACFGSAWAPPLVAIDELAKRYKDAIIESESSSEGGATWSAKWSDGARLSLKST